MCVDYSGLSRLALALCCYTVHLTFAYSLGAPPSRCGSLTPGHPSTSQPLPGPYRITLSKDEYGPFEQVDVTIEAPGSLRFAGFLIQGVDANDINTYVGTFQPASGAKYVCGQSGLTHTSGNLKESQTFQWRAPLSGLRDVVFRATVVQDYFTFYVDMRSKILKQFLPTSTIHATTTSSANNVTSFTLQPSSLTQSTHNMTSGLVLSSTVATNSIPSATKTSLFSNTISTASSSLSNPTFVLSMTESTSYITSSVSLPTNVPATVLATSTTTIRQIDNILSAPSASENNPSSSLGTSSTVPPITITVSQTQSETKLISSILLASSVTKHIASTSTDIFTSDFESSTSASIQKTSFVISPSSTQVALSSSTLSSSTIPAFNSGEKLGGKDDGDDSSEMDIKETLIITFVSVWVVVVVFTAVMKYFRSKRQKETASQPVMQSMSYLRW